MQTLSIINEITVSFIEAVIIIAIFTFLINNRNFMIENKFKSIIFIILYTLFSYFASTYMPTGLHTVCITVFLIVVLSFITLSNIYTSTTIVLLISALIIITEVIIFIIEMSIFNIGMAMILEIPYMKLLHTTASKIIQIIIVFILYKFKGKLFGKKLSIKKNKFPMFISLQVFMMGVFIFSLNYVVSHQSNITLYNILLFSIYLLVIILAFIDYKEREKLLAVQNKFKLQEEYVKNMEIVMNIIRREKHDFANHLNTIFALCLIKNKDSLERIETYIRKLSNNLNTSYSFYHTGNDYIDGLLAVKSNYAFENDINFEVEIQAPLSEVSVRDSDLTSIIGNIVDNAFEAISHENSEGKIVSIYTYIENEQYCISILDNGKKISEENIKNIFANGFSTKKNKEKNHGFGLYITKQLINQNRGKITVSSTDEETEFLIKFKVGKLEHGKVGTEAYQCNTV